MNKSKSKDWLDSLVWPVVGVLALLPAYHAVRMTLRHFTFQTCAYERHPLILQAYGYTSYALVGIMYFLVFTLVFGGLFYAYCGTAKAWRQHRENSKSNKVLVDHEREFAQSLLKPIRDRKPDVKIKLRSVPLWLLALNFVVKFLRFWPAAIFSLLCSPGFVVIATVCGGIAGGVFTAKALEDALCLPAFPLWLVGLTVFAFSIYIANWLGDVTGGPRYGKKPYQKVWSAIWNTSDSWQQRLKTCGSRYASDELHYGIRLAVGNDANVRAFKRQDHGISFKTAEKTSKVTTISYIYNSTARTFHIYATQNQMKKVLYLSCVQFPRRAVSEQHLKQVSEQMLAAFSLTALSALSVTEPANGDKA